MTKYSMEKHVRIYNDEDGSFLELRPDTDALGLLQISQVDDEGKPNMRRVSITLSRKQAEMMQDAIEEVLKNNSNISLEV